MAARRAFITGSLRNKLLMVLLLITLIPLGILAQINYQTLKTQLIEDQGGRLSGFSQRIARTIDIAMNERMADVGAWATLETVRTAIEIGGGQVPGIDVHCDVDVRLSLLRPQRLRRIGALEAQILQILPENADRRLSLGLLAGCLRRLGAGRGGPILIHFLRRIGLRSL